VALHWGVHMFHLWAYTKLSIRLFSSAGLISYITIYRAPRIGRFIVVASLWIGQPGVRFPAGATGVSVLQNVQTGSGAFPASSTPEVNRPVLEIHYSSPTPRICLHSLYRDDFTPLPHMSVRRYIHVYIFLSLLSGVGQSNTSFHVT
jgi:hypothetical protein